MIRRLLGPCTLAIVLMLLTGTGTAAFAQSQEGITVHGRWTIDVRNADGSLAAHHEFNNALTPGEGGRFLAGMLGRSYRAISSWSVLLVTPEADVCANNLGARSCPIYEWSGASPAPVGQLTVVTPANSGTLELRGMAQFIAPGTIGSVVSRAIACQSADCSGGTNSVLNFTSHALSTPIVVAANQVVQVTVVFSFS